MTNNSIQRLAKLLIFVTSVQWCGAALGQVTMKFLDIEDAGISSHPTNQMNHGRDGAGQLRRSNLVSVGGLFAQAKLAAADFSCCFAGDSRGRIATINV